MSVKLPPAPRRIDRLARDDRGYPVPWFVAWFEGRPDFRVVYPGRREAAFSKGLCWICGDPLGAHRVYVIGPMCLITRTTSEPACHRECAEYAAAACPFLTRPRMRRNEKDLPEGHYAPGIAIPRNPGVTCLYETRKAVSFAASEDEGDWLIRLGAPDRVDWWAEGRRATRAEVWASIESGYPILLGYAKRDGRQAVAQFERMREAIDPWLPAVEAA